MATISGTGGFVLFAEGDIVLDEKVGEFVGIAVLNITCRSVGANDGAFVPLVGLAVGLVDGA